MPDTCKRKIMRNIKIVLNRNILLRYVSEVNSDSKEFLLILRSVEKRRVIKDKKMTKNSTKAGRLCRLPNGS